MFISCLVLAAAWAALAFGAVYPWAYFPLYIALGILGLWGIFGPAVPGRKVDIAFVPVLAVLVCAAALQLMPVSRPTLLTISPAADALLQRYDLQYAAAITSGAAVTHPLSINPVQTLPSVLQLLALSILFLGLTRVLDGNKLRLLVALLVVLGAVIAAIGIVQRPIFTGRIYGVWTPSSGPLFFTQGGGPFGPFINRNHFAGWMLMTVPLAIGYFVALVSRDASGSGWRQQLMWFLTPEASKAALVGFAILLMSLSLVMTLSRSGFVCFIVGLVISAMASLRRQRGRWQPIVLVGFLVFVTLLSLSWAGAEMLAWRFQQADATLGGRWFAWQDALSVFRAFPFTGTGLNSYSTASLFYQTFNTNAEHFAEAHNDYLQLLAEGGMLLLIPSLLLIWTFVFGVSRRFRAQQDDTIGYWLRLGAVTGLVAILLQEIGDFSLQIPANAVLFVVLAAIAVRKPTLRDAVSA